jgi:LysR family transcriptional regulator, chromosome initiation inhibitor
MSLLSANLKAFMTVARLGTVHGAADELHLTQTGVTQRIRAIEKDLATTLFLRSRKGMKLTQEGEALLRYCRGAEDLEGQVLSQIVGAGRDQPIYVTIAGPTSVTTARIIDQCAGLYEQWPNLYLNFVISDSVDRLALVRSGQATIAIVSSEQVPNEMDSKTIKPDKYILVGSSKWRGRRLTDVLEKERIIDFDENDPTTLNYLKKFNLASHVSKARLFANNNESIIKLFCKGVGFGTLTHEIAKPHIESGELIALNGGAIMEDELAAAWYPRPEIPAYFKAIIGVLK